MDGIIVKSKTQKIVVNSNRSIGVINAGPPGPPGVSLLVGGRQAPITHIQSVASASWTVTHNLGYKPTVDILTDNDEQMFPDIVHLSLNAYSVIFALPTVGSALSR